MSENTLKIIKNHLILIPFNLPWEWSTDYTNQTAFNLAKENTVVCYMWGETYSVKEYLQKTTVPKLIRKYSENIYLFYPILFVPFRRFKPTVLINEKINLFLLNIFIVCLRRMKNIKNKILWIFDPNLEPLTQFFNKDWFLLYDCVDYFLSTAQDERERRLLTQREKKLTIKADLVTANSTVLQRHLTRYRKNVPLVSQGFRVESFQMFNSEVPQIKSANRPLIGFVGAVNHRIDYSLLYKLAGRNPQWDFAVWGPFLQKENFSKAKLTYNYKLTKLKNVITGKSDKNNIPGIISQFDIGMIPYDPTMDFNKYCYPMKLFEFFYLELPVVSTEIEELKRFPNLVKIGNSHLEWEKIIKSLLSKNWPDKYKKEQKKLAFKNSWVNKINEISIQVVKLMK